MKTNFKQDIDSIKNVGLHADAVCDEGGCSQARARSGYNPDAKEDPSKPPMWSTVDPAIMKIITAIQQTPIWYKEITDFANLQKGTDANWIMLNSARTWYKEPDYANLVATANKIRSGLTAYTYKSVQDDARAMNLSASDHIIVVAKKVLASEAENAIDIVPETVIAPKTGKTKSTPTEDVIDADVIEKSTVDAAPTGTSKTKKILYWSLGIAGGLAVIITTIVLIRKFRKK